MKPSRHDSTPHCWWCHQPVPVTCPYRTLDPTINIPGVGIVVCSPYCRKRPAESEVFTRQRIIT